MAEHELIPGQSQKEKEFLEKLKIKNLNRTREKAYDDAE